MEAILRGMEMSKIKDVVPRVVISNKPDAPGLQKAAKMGVLYEGCIQLCKRLGI